ncbi:MAG: hypothetical protein WCF26_12655 [Candidatus Sulfotelmatobacter sp.]
MFRESGDVFSARVGTDAFVRPVGQSPAARGRGRWRAPLLVALVILFAVPLLRAADCISIQEAGQHVGETRCVAGKVVRVKVGVKGVHFLDFCEDQLACPFTVVVFEHDLKDVGDVRRLAGRTIEIRGALKLYDGRPEIILNRISQITGGAAMIPPLPKAYDVENRGHYSAGHLYHAKKPAKTKATPNISATYDVEGEEPP